MPLHLAYDHPPLSLGLWTKAKGNLTQVQRVRRWRQRERRRQAMTPAIRARVEARFATERQVAFAALRQGQADIHAIERVDRAVGLEAPGWTRLYRALYLTVAQPFGLRSLVEIRSGLVPPERRADDWTDEDIDDILRALGSASIEAEGAAALFLERLPQAVFDYIETIGSSKIGGILEETKQVIRGLLREGIEAGESIDQLAQRLTDQFTTFDVVRAERIARTETVAASEFGTRQGALSTGLDLLHQWLATQDTRTRGTHSSANGQERPSTEPFVINGYQLWHAGDSSLGAPARETVNCRCVVVYRVNR